MLQQSLLLYLKQIMKNTKPAKRPASRRKPVARKNRPLHRRISLHPFTIMLLLCIGILMLYSTYQALGASTSVSMSITALPLEDPATITSPADQSRFSVPGITVNGTCPNESYVKLHRNDTFRGVAACENGKFTIALTLDPGINVLLVKVFNFSDVEGPQSGSITIYYDTPATTSSPASTTTLPTQEPIDHLRIITDYKYRVYASGQPVNLDLVIAGGVPPFAVAVEWGDGKVVTMPRQDRSPFHVEHTYNEEPLLHKYTINVVASDIEGRTDQMQLIAIVDGNTPQSSSVTSTTPPGSITGSKFQTWLKYLWPAYSVVILMVLCFYLGERAEHQVLSRKNHTPILR
jgi:hypothetical protein